MPLQSINPTQTAAWQKLQLHFEQTKNVRMQDLFVADPQRAEKFHLQFKDCLLDYSKNRINTETMALLQELAVEVQLADAIEKYFSGDLINMTEGRAVLRVTYT